MTEGSFYGIIERQLSIGLSNIKVPFTWSNRIRLIISQLILIMRLKRTSHSRRLQHSLYIFTVMLNKNPKLHLTLYRQVLLYVFRGLIKEKVMAKSSHFPL